MTSIYKTEMTVEQGRVLEELRRRIACVVGVTLVGNRLTVRYGEDGALASAHMVITKVTTPEEHRESLRKMGETCVLYEKYPDLEAELYFIEHGEWPQ